MTSDFQNYVDGSWTDAASGETLDLRNPADTTELIGEFQHSGREDAREAIEAANAAQSKWADTTAPERGRVLRNAAGRLANRKDELAEMLTREEGKPLSEATGEVQRAIDIFYYCAEKARDYSGQRKNPSSERSNLHIAEEPVGVAGLITPWNYPIAIPAWKIAPAIATGNTVVFKPAEPAPVVGIKLVEALDQAGVPDGVVNLVSGPGSTVGDEIVTNDGIDTISFTGSAAVGKQVYETATEEGKRAQCEMGGKNPTVVMPSADIDEAVSIVANGAFGGTGQACTACSRAIVHEDVHDELIRRLVKYAESIEIGPGLDGYDMGPQINESEKQGTLDYIEIGIEEGATLETGERPLNGPRFENGYFVQPAVFSGVTPKMRVAQEEIFGPVVSVLEVSDYDEALEVANNVTYGLSGSIVTDNHTEAMQFVSDIEAGVAKINEKTTGLELHVPFGGFKDSSTETWREQGGAGFDFYTISKTVYDNY